MHEVGTLLVAIIFSITGGNATPVDQTGNQPADPCASYDANSCLQQSECDMFQLSSGADACKTACDVRTSQATCEDGGPCSWHDGYCTYGDDPVGC